MVRSQDTAARNNHSKQGNSGGVTEGVPGFPGSMKLTQKMQMKNQVQQKPLELKGFKIEKIHEVINSPENRPFID
jgi:hypothetical protein